MKKKIEVVFKLIEDWDLDDLERLQAEIEDLVALKDTEYLNSIV